MNLKRVNCYLCVDKPAPKDLKHHIMFYHMVENDIAVENIFWMHFSSQATTQTTVTWTDEFSYYDHRSESEATGDKARETKELSPTLERKFHRKRRRNHSAEHSLNTKELRKNDYETKKVQHQEKKSAVVANDLETSGTRNNDELASTMDGFEKCAAKNEKEKVTQDEVSEEPPDSTSFVKDFYDYGYGLEESPKNDENKRSLYRHQANNDSVPESEVNQCNILNEESPPSASVSHLQDVVKKFGNSISIINVKDANTNGFTSVDDSHIAVNELEVDCPRRSDLVLGIKPDSNINVEDEDLESIVSTEKHVDEGDVKKTKTETLTVDNIQNVAEKLGISISISGCDDDRVLETESSDRSNSTNTEEEINLNPKTSWCLETLLENGAISVAKFAPEENEKEDEESFDSVEMNGITIESEKEKTTEDQTDTRFLSSDEENSHYESESPLERLVSSGLLSINKIERSSNKNDEDLEQVFTEEDCVRYACSFCEFVSYRKDIMEEHIFTVHEVAGRPLKQNMIVRLIKTLIPVEETEELEEFGTDMTSLSSTSSVEEYGKESITKSNEIEDEAFNSDEEFDDDDDDFDY